MYEVIHSVLGIKVATQFKFQADALAHADKLIAGWEHESPTFRHHPEWPDFCRLKVHKIGAVNLEQCDFDEIVAIHRHPMQ